MLGRQKLQDNSCLTNCGLVWTQLEKLAFADNLSATDSDSLLQCIKTLAVTTLHPSIHVVNLHQMRQNNDEPTKAFSARVRSVAANYNREKKCTGPTCMEMVSYIEETCYHVVYHLHHPNLKIVTVWLYNELLNTEMSKMPVIVNVSRLIYRTEWKSQ